MFLSKKNLFFVLTSLIGLTSCIDGMTPTVKKAEDVFKKWLSWQQVMPDKNLDSMTHALDDNFLVAFREQYEKKAPLLVPLTSFLNSVTASHIYEHGYYLRSPMSQSFVGNLSSIYNLLQYGMDEFISVLKNADFLSIENLRSEETGHGSHDAIEKYNALFDLLFAHPDEIIRNQYLFAVANQFYEYCFGPDSYNNFEKNLLDKTLYPIIRMLYSVTWLNLAGNGWKHWHEDCLKTLKERADLGHHFVYIAGGSDIYQLIKAGIYNIKNIDPQLPSQPKYYTDEWQFIVSGRMGDKIIFTFDDRTVTMERIGFAMPGTVFKARIATGEVIEVPQSTTTWKLTDHDGNTLGHYILERRLCEQADFINQPNKTLLMSFNELYFICLPGILNGWNIEPSQFDTNLSIVVKQLRKPVDKQMMINMRIASLLNATDFKFIALGTCIN